MQPSTAMGNWEWLSRTTEQPHITFLLGGFWRCNHMCSIVKSSISQGPRAVLVAERSPSPSHQFPAPHGYSDSWLPRAAGYAAPRLPGARRPIGSAEATAAAVGSTLGWERPEGRRGIGWGKSMGKWDFTGENMERSWECNDIYIYMYVCMYACMYVCMYVCIHIYI